MAEDPLPLAAYEEALWESPVALDWLHARGLDQETILRFSLGWTGEEGKYRRSVVIPYFAGTNELVALRYRSLDPNAQAKYRDHYGEKGHLFNVGSLRNPVVHLTEGEFDAMILEQQGFNAVGVPGVHRFKEEWRWLFLGCDIRIVMDGDQPGQEAAERLSGIIEPYANRVDVIDLPEGEDVSSMFVKDREGLLGCLSAWR